MSGSLRRLMGACVGGVLLASALVLSISPAGSAQFPGANGRIGYSSVDFSGSSIHLINPDGSGDVQVVTGGRDASWNFGGTKMTYTTLGATENSVMIANGDGTGATVVYTAPSGFSVWYPTMSSDGSKIAFVQRNPGYTVFDLYVVNSDGTGLTNLTSGVYEGISFPQFSADGTKVLFGGIAPSEPQSLYAATISPAAVALISADKQYGTWMPDGTILAIQMGAGSSTVFRMNADGSGVTTLFTSTGIGLPGPVMFPCPSPDGTTLVFTVPGEGPGTSAIWMSAIDGSGARVIVPASGGFDQISPNWISGDVVPTPPTTSVEPDPTAPAFTG